MAKDRLIGNDGKFVKATFGAEVSASTTLTADTLYLVTGVDTSSSGFPAGAEAGYLLYAAGTETLAGTDTAKPVTLVDLCDIQGWSINATKADIEVTTLCDSQKIYRVGKPDQTGTSTGVFKIGTTDLDGGIQNKFVDIVRVASASYQIDKLDDEPIYAQLITQKDTDSGETEQYYFAPIAFNSFSQGANVGDEAQTFEAGFRITTDATNNVKFAYYSRPVA